MTLGLSFFDFILLRITCVTKGDGSTNDYGAYNTPYQILRKD